MLGLLLLGCSSTVQQQEKTVEHPKPPQIQALINDSLFYEVGVREFEFSDIEDVFNANREKLSKVNNELKSQLSNCLDFNAQILNAYYYTDFKNVGNITAIIILLTTMESKYFVLITTSNGSDLSSCIQLTEDRCDLVDQQEDSEEIWCDTKKAFIDEFENLVVISIHSIEMNYGSYFSLQEDSITNTYQINNQGLSLLQRDSVRIEN